MKYLYSGVFQKLTLGVRPVVAISSQSGGSRVELRSRLLISGVFFDAVGREGFWNAERSSLEPVEPEL